MHLLVYTSLSPDSRGSSGLGLVSPIPYLPVWVLGALHLGPILLGASGLEDGFKVGWC